MSNCISLDEWRLEFYIRVNQTNELDDTAFHAMIQEMNKKLSEIGKAMAESSIPEQQT